MFLLVLEMVFEKKKKTEHKYVVDVDVDNGHHYMGEQQHKAISDIYNMNTNYSQDSFHHKATPFHCILQPITCVVMMYFYQTDSHAGQNDVDVVLKL